MIKIVSLLIILIQILFGATLYAQFPPRVEDHFWRKKVLERIDLEEKLNKSLKYKESPLYTKGKYGETKGIVYALINGYKDGKYIGYQFGALQKPLTYKDFEKMMYETGPVTPGSDSGSSEEEEEEFEDEGGDEMEEGQAEQTTDGQTQGDNLQANNSQGDPAFAAYEDYIGIIEDRIFDKNKSDMYYDIQYICLYKTDDIKGGYQPQVCFSYKDVMDILDDTQYKNPKNDAEYRSIKEIIELRLFKSVMEALSGEELDLKMAEKRNNQMVEYEHHLWEF